VASRPCQAVTPQGLPCRAYARRGGDLCAAHLGLTGPGKAGRARLSLPRSAGGQESRALRAESRDVRARLFALERICVLLKLLRSNRRGRIPTGDPGQAGELLVMLQLGKISLNN
jgi:hypothetical protein